MRTVVAAGTLVILASALAAQPRARADSGALRGSVLDEKTNRPIADAEVAIEELGLSVRTDTSGRFRVMTVPAGRREVTVRRLGYAPITTMAQFTARDTLDYEFALRPGVTSLPSAEVRTEKPATGKLAEFDERRRIGLGQYLTEAQLAKIATGRLSEAVRGFRGVSLRYAGVSNVYVRSTRGGCFAAVMIDGAYVYRGNPGERLFDINSISTNMMSAVEYYSALDAPAKFTGARGCGVLLIWTK